MIDVLFYSPGGGGGHLNRCVSIARVLERHGVTTKIGHQNPSPRLLEIERLDGEEIEGNVRGNECPGQWQGRFAFALTSPETPRDFVPHGGTQFVLDNPARVVVRDVYTLGIKMELLGLDLPSRQVHLRRRGHEPQDAHFDLVLAVEEGGEGVPCWPVLIRDPDELLDRQKAREVLQVDDRPVIAVVTAWEHWWAEEVAAGLQAALPETNVIVPDYYPLMELMRGIDVVVGAAGYNLAAEVRATGTPAVLVPRDRDHHDDQSLRSNCPDHMPIIEQQVQAALARPRVDRVYDNGARIAGKEILELLG